MWDGGKPEEGPFVENGTLGGRSPKKNALAFLTFASYD